LFDNFPVDRVLAALDLAKEPADLVGVEDDLKLSNEEQVTAIYKETIKYLADHNKVLEGQHGTIADAKDIFVGDKYKAKDLLTAVSDALKHLKDNSKIADDEPAAAEGDKKEEEPKAEGAEMEGGEMHEGGDEAEAAVDPGAMADMAGSMEKPNPFKYDGDSRSYEGWNQVAASLLRNMLVNPVFGDMMKANALSWEYNHDSTKKYEGLSKACALVSAAAAKAASGENNVFISGFVDADSHEALGDLVTDKKPIHFPFVTAGWGSKDDALAAFDHTPISDKKKGDYKKVLFEVTGAASFEFAGCRQICHRLNGEISGGTAADDVHVYQVKAVKLEA
jgi:hypothetical protein